MALIFTITKKYPVGGGMYCVLGSFTSANNDISATLPATDHGLNYIPYWWAGVGTGVIGAPTFKGVVTNGSIALEFADTRGATGEWCVIGK